MTASRQDRRRWEDKLKALAKARRQAVEAELVGIYEARRAGLSQAVAASAIGDKSGSGIKAKEIKGREIYERRRGGRAT